MKKLLYFLLIFPVSIIEAQEFEWLKNPSITFSQNPEMIGYANTFDPSGNVYLAGFKENSFLYSSDILGNLMYNKYDSSGQLLFSKTFGGNATIHNMKSDTHGNIIVAVLYVTTVTIGDLVLSTVEQGVHPLLLKFDPDGNLLWHYQPAVVGSGSNISNLKGITIDTQDNIYIAYDNYWNSYISKISPDGSILFTIFQSQVPSVSSVAVDTEGNIYAAGSCAGTISTYAGVLAPTNLSYSTYAVKYSPEGVFQWIKYVNDITCSTPIIKANTPDQIYFCSHLYGAYPFDSIATEGPLSGTFYDYFLAKLNASGTWQWVREVPGTGAFTVGHREYMGVDHNGNAYVAGATTGTINWGNGITSNSQSSGNDAIVVKYNPEGVLQSAITAGGNSQDRVDCVSADESGIYISGMARGNSTYGALSFESAGTAAYPFMTKINNSTLQLTSPTAEVLQAYPNPASDYVYIKNFKGKTTANIFTVLGQKVQEIVIEENQPITIKSLAKGVYFIKINGFKSIKLIKE